MKRTINILIAALAILPAAAQTNTAPAAHPTIKGNMEISYGSRTQVDGSGKPTMGAKDIYNVNVNVANSAIFKGTIIDYPLVMGGVFGGNVAQARSLNYDIACDVVNPKNPAQIKNVGRMFGKVPIEQSGTYRYDTGSLQVSVLPIGNAGGFDSKFSGTTIGKPLIRPLNWLETMQRSAVNITRSVNGKTMTVVLKKYDKMEFRQHTIGAGPVAVYSSCIVNGEMLYDYDKSCWFFNNVTVQSSAGFDRLTGNIRWMEAASGEGEYQFDIRVNEPPPNEGAAFSPASDEAAFFETDSKVPSLTGTMKYKDTKKGKITLSSAVTIDLVGNNLTKQQAMILCKIIIFSTVVPMNSD